MCFQNFCFIHVHLFGLFKQEVNSLIFARNRKSKITMRAKNTALSSDQCDRSPSTFSMCSFTGKNLLEYGNIIQIKWQDSITDNNSCNILMFLNFCKYCFLRHHCYTEFKVSLLYTEN